MNAKRSIFQDPVNPSDFMKYDFVFCCEQCSHFDQDHEACTQAYPARNHLRANQLRSYEVSGRMAFCRHQEID